MFILMLKERREITKRELLCRMVLAHVKNEFLEECRSYEELLDIANATCKKISFTVTMQEMGAIAFSLQHMRAESLLTSDLSKHHLPQAVFIINDNFVRHLDVTDALELMSRLTLAIYNQLGLEVEVLASPTIGPWYVGLNPAKHPFRRTLAQSLEIFENLKLELIQ